MNKDIPALYGSLVFNDKVMRNKLPKDIYKALKKTIENFTITCSDCRTSPSSRGSRSGANCGT